jgi:hypothetical protein
LGKISNPLCIEYLVFLYLSREKSENLRKKPLFRDFFRPGFPAVAQTGRITPNLTRFTVKVTFAVIGEDGEAIAGTD